MVTPFVVVCGQRQAHTAGLAGRPHTAGRELGMGSVWIAGSYQSDFARNFAREGLEISDMVAEAVNGTLTSAGLEPEDVESIHVGNAFGQLFTGQGQLGAMPATVEPRLWGKPAARHEGARASGSVAVLAATAEIEAGRHDRILRIAG